MKRPSFQFYPADWKNNANLRRCSEAARGVWMDIMCVLHDSDQYGVVRWPLAELARAAGVALKYAKELVAKDVLKGAESGPVTFTHTPRHAGKDGEPVILVTGDGPVWFSSRMVRDEWRRSVSGGKTRFTDEQPSTKPVTMPRQGEVLGDGASTSTSTSVSSSTGEDKSSPGADGAVGAVVFPSKVVGDLPDWWPTRDRLGRVTSEITEKIMFDVGKAVLGKTSGGQVTRMRKAYSGDMRAVVDFLLQADEKSDASEWFAGVLKRAERDQHIEPKHSIYPREHRA